MTFSILDTPLAGGLRQPEPRREAWNPALEPALVPAPGIEPALTRLRSPGALVVTTGQQPGLFTGPAYAITKALSARGLARRLEAAWGRPVVPVYWVPGDDHDFDEVSFAQWLGADGELRRTALPPRNSDAPLTPMYRQPLGPAILGGLDAFEGSFADEVTSGPTVAWLRRHYRPEATVAGAFAGAMAELLAPFGILCLDSTHPALKAAAAPLVARSLDEAAALEQALAARSAELLAVRQDPGVPVGDGAALVFLESAQGRDRLVRNGDGFVTRRGREAMSAAELRALAAEAPGRFSGNVLLRPVIESAVLPTVAYVAGPGELRYLALAEPLYRILGVARQLPVARWSGLLVEPRVERTLRKFEARVGDALADGQELETRIARAALPEGTEAGLAQLRDAIRGGFDPLLARALALDPTLERPARSAEARALFAVERLEKKLLQAARRREAVELAQIARASTSLRPLGKPQERVLTLSGFLARYGDSLLESFAEHIAQHYQASLVAASPTA